MQKYLRLLLVQLTPTLTNTHFMYIDTVFVVFVYEVTFMTNLVFLVYLPDNVNWFSARELMEVIECMYN